MQVNQPPPPPPCRQIIHKADASLSLEGSAAFSVLCYNILCPQYASAALYPYTPPRALEWNYRRDLIMNEIRLYSCDFVCMQEVNWDIYDEWLSEMMKQEGYESVYCPARVKSLARNNGKRERDGCAVFWKAERSGSVCLEMQVHNGSLTRDIRYGLVEDQLIEFSNLAKKRQDFKSCKAVSKRLLQRGNIGIICLFECFSTRKQLLLTNTHIFWDPEFCDVKLVQVGMLLREMEIVANRVRSEMAEVQPDGPLELPIVLCGDFNSLPSSGVYEFLSTGTVPKDHPDFKRFQYGRFTKHGMRHGLGLRSAYAARNRQSDEGEVLPWTNYTAHFKGVLDYIWYSEDTLDSKSILGEIDEGYLEAEKLPGFPHTHFPSEWVSSDHVEILYADTQVYHSHIPIMTELAWRVSTKASM